MLWIFIENEKKKETAHPTFMYTVYCVYLRWPKQKLAIPMYDYHVFD